MNEFAQPDPLGKLLAEVRNLTERDRHRRLLELGADPLLIAQVNAILLAEAETSALAGPRAGQSVAGIDGRAELGEGDQLGSWRLLREIGSGGMGAVYLAERSDGHFDQHVAIKLIRGIPDTETFLHFARERQILARLQHPDIARLLDGGATPGGQPYLVMEYVEGVPIERFCEDNALGLDARLRLFQRVCAAVQYAHQRLVVHCDLKPSNVLVRGDGAPVLLDFGIARALDQQAGRREETSASAWVTPLYASPEQLRGEPVTTASDVFSLGLILFELLAGRRARLDADDHTITLLGKSAIKPSELAGAMPWTSRLRGDLDAIVQRATAAEPTQRYESAEALAGDIQRHLDWRPVEARKPASGYLLGRLIRRRWPIFAAAAILLMLASAFTWQIARERDRALVAERNAVIQARTAERASDFLVSVFNVSNPRLSSKRTLSARDVLDEGAERIENELSDAPEIKAKMLASLGSAYRYIGESARAVELLGRSSQLYLDPRVDQPLAAASVLSALAVVYNNNNYPASKADQAASEALRLRELHAPPDSLPIADALNTLGIVRQSEDRFDEAESLLLRSLAIRERLAGKESSQVASTLHNLGLVESSRGRDLARAIAYFERAMALKKALKGERSPDFETSQSDYGKALREAGDLVRSAEVLRRNLALAREIYGDGSEMVATGHNELGYTLHDMGQFAGAAEEYQASMAIRKALGGDQGAAFAIPLNNLASAYEDMGEFGKAEPMFRRSLELRRAGQDADSALIANAEYNLARLLVKRGQLDEAREHASRALAIHLKRHGQADRNVIKVEMIEVERMLEAHDLEGASTLFAQVLASPARLDDKLLARRYALAARIAEQRGEPKKALAATSEAWDVIRKAWGERHPLTLEYGLDYARQMRRSGEPAKAAALVSSISDLATVFSPASPVRRKLEDALR